MKRDKLWLYAWDWVLYISIHLEKEMATHSSVVAWRISGTGEPGGLPSMGSHRVGHDWSDLAAAAAAYRSHILLMTLMQIICVFMCINTHTHTHTHTNIYIYICNMYRHVYYPTSGAGDRKGGLVCCSPWGHSQTQLSDWTKLMCVYSNAHIWINICLDHY